MSGFQRRARLPRLTWSRAGVAISVAVITFGAADALLPRSAVPSQAPIAVRGTVTGDRVANLPAQMLAARQTAAQQVAAQQVAVRFVIACDTTNPAQPHGDVATETALAPGLVRHDVSEPPAWRIEERATTVTLDPPGQPVGERGQTVAVIVTGTMTVTSDSAPPQIVPIAERIALRPFKNDHSAGDAVGGPRASSWQIVDVEVGS
jgi:hypothetical protein